MIKEKTEIVLVEGQQKALTEMLDWCDDKNSLLYTLTGRAGTGKTTILKVFIDKCPFKYRLCVSAPTHKAKRVVSEKTGKPGETIQKLLGLRPDTNLDDFDVNTPEFAMLSEASIIEYSIVIIDEASMLNSELYDYIVKESEKYRVKLLFVGDDAQINPVKEKISKIFKVERQSKLTQVIRQSGENPIMELFQILTNDIDNHTFNYLQFLKDNSKNFNENGDGYECIQMADFQARMLEYFSSEEFKLNPDYCKYIAWTNKSIKGLNNFIRQKVLNTEELLTEGELLMAYNSVMGQFNDIILMNSEDYKVKTVTKHTSDHGVNGYYIKLEASAMNTEIFIVDPEDDKIFLQHFNEYLSIAKKKKGRAWVQYFNFKKEHLLIRDIHDGNGKLIIKKDIDYGYGITSHKSQGSTFGNVFINLNDVNNNSNPLERKRLTYVALSRMTNKAFILI